VNKFLACLLLSGSLMFFTSCQTTDGGTEIPNELTGREIIAGTGKAAEKADIKLVPVGYVPGADSSQAIFTASSDAQGHFSFKDVPAGQYNVLASQDNLLSFRDSVTVTGKGQDLNSDTLKAPGSLAGTVRLQPQHDPRIVTVQVLGTTVFVNVDASGKFSLVNLGAGTYRLRVFVNNPDYTSLYKEVEVRTGKADTLPEPLEPFYSGTPVVTGLRASPGAKGTVSIRWNKTTSYNAEAYLIYRDSATAILPSTQPIARVTDTVFIDTIYSAAPREGQYSYLDTVEHAFTYRVAVLSRIKLPGPTFESADVTAIPPSAALVSGAWKQALASAPFSKRYGSSLVEFQNKLWLLGGSARGTDPLHDVWSSPDGMAWQKVADSAQGAGGATVVFQNKLWSMHAREISSDGSVTTYANDLWNSADGIHWTKVTDSADFPGRTGFAFLVYQDKLWVLNGLQGLSSPVTDVRYSTDGIVWKQALVNSDFIGENQEGAAVFNDKMWLSGGGAFVYGSNNNQIWSSSDGSAWSPAADSARFIPRVGVSLVAHGGKLWHIAGADPLKYADTATYFNEVRSSPDGSDWTLVDAHAPFAVRAFQAAASFQGRLWVIGGTSVKADYNDVWYMESP
jgi:hypothetical protein